MKLKDIRSIQPYRFYSHEEANKILDRIKKHDGELVGITQVIEKEADTDIHTVAYDLWVVLKGQKEIVEELNEEPKI